MVSALEEVDPIVAHQIDESVLLSDSARPQIRAKVPDRLGLSDSLEGVSGDPLHQVHDFECDTPIGVDPETQIFPELILEEGCPGRSGVPIRGQPAISRIRGSPGRRNSQELAGGPEVGAARS